MLGDLERRVAERAHDAHGETIKQLNEASVETGSLTLRTVVFVNGGAAVAVLAFVGALAAKDRIDTAQLGAIAGAIVWFAAGVAAGALALGAGYLTNFSNAKLLHSHELTWTLPYVKPGPKTKLWSRIVGGLQIVAVALGFASLILFILGMWDVRVAIVQLATKV